MQERCRAYLSKGSPPQDGPLAAFRQHRLQAVGLDLPVPLAARVGGQAAGCGDGLPGSRVVGWPACACDSALEQLPRRCQPRLLALNLPPRRQPGPRPGWAGLACLCGGAGRLAAPGRLQGHRGHTLKRS